MSLWLEDPNHVTNTIKMLCNSFPPCNALSFKAVAEVCALYIQNAWNENHSDDWSDLLGVQPEAPCDGVVPCLRYFLSGIVDCVHRKRKLEGNITPDKWKDVINAERNMEFCVTTLRHLFVSDLFVERLTKISEADADGWAEFRVCEPPIPHPVPPPLSSPAQLTHQCSLDS